MNLERFVPLTKMVTSTIISTAGETEAGSAGEQPARDNRSGYGEFRPGSLKYSPPTLYIKDENSLFPLCLKKRTLAAGKLIAKTYCWFFHFTLNQYTTKSSWCTTAIHNNDMGCRSRR